MRAIILAIAASSLVFTPTPSAFAQPKKPAGKADSKTNEAKKLFDEGADAYSLGNYEEAIAAWEKSYELSKKPLIFESIANAYERLGDPKKAREYLQRWRDVAPKEEHELLDTRLKNLDARIAREEELEAARKKAEAEKGQASSETPPPSAAGQGSTPPPSTTKEEPKGSVAGVVLIGAGAAAVAVGVTLDVIAAIRRPDASACGMAGDLQLCKASERGGIQTSNVLSLVGDGLWIAGGLAAAAGVVLVVTHKSPKKETTGMTFVAPSVHPRGAGLSVTHSF